jgi:hypothetical protein
VKVVIDAETGLGKGYGFVKYREHDAAAKALESFNGYELHGSKISVFLCLLCALCSAPIVRAACARGFAPHIRAIATRTELSA